ncbi:unnamed protein product [Pocillopora meandrina]|uniref:Uncharacterized protein n=1 Tax=Pocillopora meandrina TaxID=46732 RepID=A0AAU9X6H7_9CNID|nr:unnamed protein product [Pocillopora meandrina]
MVLKFKSVQYVIIFTIYLLDEFHQTSPQNETEYKTISSSKSIEEPGKSTAVSAKQNSSGNNNESIFLTLLPQNNLSVQSTHTVLQVNSTPIPTLDPQTNSIVQSTTLPLQHNLTLNGSTITFLRNCHKPLTTSNTPDEKEPATGFAVIPFRV